MKFNNKKIASFIYLIFTTSMLFAQNSNFEKIFQNRVQYFDKGSKIDTVLLYKSTLSQDSAEQKFAKAILANYYLRINDSRSEKIWWDLVFYEWFEDDELISQELLIIDDLFRASYIQKRYYNFYYILSKIYKPKVDLFLQTYNLITNFKSGNLYTFGTLLKNYKIRFVEHFDELSSINNQEVLDRFFANLSVIDLENMNCSENKQFINKLNQILVDNENSNLPGYLFLKKCTLDYLSKDDNQFINYKSANTESSIKSLFSGKTKQYVDPYLFVRIFDFNRMNIDDDPNYTADYLNKFYSKNEILFISTELLINQNFKRAFSNVGRLGQYYKIPEAARSLFSLDQDNINNIYEGIRKIDSIKYKNDYWFDPNWFNLKHQIAYEYYGNSGFKFLTRIYQKLSIDSIDYYSKSGIEMSTDMINYYANLDSSLRKIKLVTFHDETNFYLGYYSQLKIINEESIADTVISKKLQSYIDSTLDMITFYNNINFKDSRSNITENILFKLRLTEYNHLLQYILLQKKLYVPYLRVCMLQDSSEIYSDLKIILPTILNNALSRTRYLVFKKYASKNDVMLFDVEFVKLFKERNKYTKNRITGGIDPKIWDVLTSSLGRDILLDVGKRNDINLITYFLVSNAFENTLNESAKKQNFTYLNTNNGYSNPYNSYSNSIFCIDNKNLKLKASSIYHSLYKNSVDSIQYDNNSRNIFYFFAGDLDEEYYFKLPLDSFLFSSNTSLFSIYSGPPKLNQQLHFSKPLKHTSIKQLKDNFNYELIKSELFSASRYINYVQQNADYLYDTFLKPYEVFLAQGELITMVKPNSLGGLPLDYIYSLKNGKLPFIKDISSSYKFGIKTNKSLAEKDKIAIFSNMIYNDEYCGITKASRDSSRGSLIPLAYASSENSSIKKVFGTNAKDYTGIDANKEMFINTLLNNEIKVVHLITHGAFIADINTQFNLGNQSELTLKTAELTPNQEERMLLFFSSDSTSEKNTENILSASELDLMADLSHIKLLNLSACETGLSDPNTYKTGYVGFINNFLERGVQAILATRWKVSDKLSYIFNQKFYQNLSEYKDIEKAFFVTKQYFFEHKSDPYLWTSYILVN
jgi:CHAT domain-containing protein